MTHPSTESPKPPPRADLLRRYDNALEILDRASSLLIIVAMAVLTTVVVVQVFFRYVLNDSLEWGWDVPRLCFIWVVLLAIPLGLKHNVHVGIDLLVARLSMHHKQILQRFNAIIMICLMAILAYYALVLGEGMWDELLPGLDLSVSWFYVAMFIGAVHSLLHLVRLLWTGVSPVSGIMTE